MKFTPMSAEEIATAGLLIPGIYPFEVMDALDTFSTAGNEMIKVKLKVFGPGGEAHVYDYLMGEGKLAYKLWRCCEVVGLLSDYEKGNLVAQQLLDRTGHVKIGVEDGKNGYLPQNKVKDYVKAPAPAEQTKPQPQPRPMSAVPPLNPAPGKAATPASLAAAGMKAGGKFDDDIPF